MITVYYINVCHSVLTCFKSSATEVFQRKIVSLTVCNVTSVNSLETTQAVCALDTQAVCALDTQAVCALDTQAVCALDTQAVCALEAPLMNTEQYALNCWLTDSNAAETGPTVL